MPSYLSLRSLWRCFVSYFICEPPKKAEAERAALAERQKVVGAYNIEIYKHPGLAKVWDCESETACKPHWVKEPTKRETETLNWERVKYSGSPYCQRYKVTYVPGYSTQRKLYGYMTYCK